MWNELVCPVDLGPLAGDDHWLSCQECGRGYPILDGIPTFLPADEGAVWRKSQREQLRGLPESWPAAIPSRSSEIRHRGRELEARLSQFMHIGPRTRLLQVGMEGEAELHHFRMGKRFGVEPLAGAMNARGLLKWGALAWLAARGEELPFANGYFDAILLCDVLENAESPEQMLAEASRALAPDGVLWISSTVIRKRLLDGVGRRWTTPRPAAKGRRLWQFTPAALDRICEQARLSPLWSGWLDSSDDDVPPLALHQPEAAGNPVKTIATPPSKRGLLLQRAGRQVTPVASMPRMAA